MRVLLILMALASCDQGGSALVVVAASSTTPLHDLVALHAELRADGPARSLDVSPASGAAFEIPPEKSFAIEVPEPFAGRFELRLEARGASGATLGAGAGSTTTHPGQRVDLEIELTPDGGAEDGGI